MPGALTQQHAALETLRLLRKHGHQALWVGGCVRDLLLGREPADFDVATSATPDEVMSIFPQTYAVGAQFGVVLVPLKTLGDFGIPGNAQGYVEVATFRSDGAYLDGRHPDSVRYTTSAQHDVERRDFTINGLLLDPLSQHPNTPHGELLDYVDGRRDLERGLVRTIGPPERRFAEDKLRMLRAVRFASRFGYQIDPATMDAIRSLAPQVHQVSCERIRDELTKMLTEGQARRAFQLLDESGLLRELLPEITRMKGIEQPPQYHPEGDVFVHTLLLLAGLPAGCPPTLAWGALLHDVGKPATFRRAPDRIRFDGHVEVGVAIGTEILRRFRFSNEDTRQILALIENHMRFMDTSRMKTSTLKRFFRLDRFDEHLSLHRMDCLAGSGYLDNWEFVRQHLQTMPEEAVRPKPLITGRELIAAGYKPGAAFKQMLHAVEDAQLEGTITTEEEALSFVRNRWPEEQGGS